MASLQIQEQGAPEVAVSSKSGRSLLKTGGSHGSVPPSANDEPILVRGNLQKLGKRFKGWHQRYFEIQGSHMYHYKNASKKDCLGEINLAICFYCEPTTATSFGSPFEIRTVQRSHVLAARSKEEMQQWIQVIKQQMSPNEKEAKKGTGKKSTKPKRWESFKNTFAIGNRQRAQSPAVETQEQKKATKKSFMDRFRVKKGGQQTVSDTQTSKRPLSFTEADEKRKNTLDVFAQYDISRSAPSSPVSKRKKQSVASFETATPISPMSLTSGSPFTGGATTEDSQSSTPIHLVTASKDTAAGGTQSEMTEPSSGKAGEEIVVRVEVEDTSAQVVPIIVEPSEEEAVESNKVHGDDVAGPDKPVVVVEKETITKPVEPAEPVVAVEKEIDSGEDSSTKPAEPVTADKSSEDVPESTTKPAEPVESIAVAVEKEAESPAKPVEPTEPVEPEDISCPPETKSPVKPAKQDEPTPVPEKVEDSMKEPSGATADIERRETEGEAGKEVVEPATFSEKEAEKMIQDKPVLPVKPVVVEEKEAKTTIKGKQEESEEEPFIPGYLKDTVFQWDKIREILDTASDSTETESYSELPAEDTSSWVDKSSPVEQLRAFLLVCP